MSEIYRRFSVAMAVVGFFYVGQGHAQCVHDANDEWPVVPDMVCQPAEDPLQEPPIAAALQADDASGGNATHPQCQRSDSDPDGDGWGWEQNRSCRVAAQYSNSVCKNSNSDPDGDGWGWENNRSCRVSTSPKVDYTVCQSSNSDPDRDGWGYENGQSCRVASGTSNHPQCSSTGVDPDGDGWGYENGRSCRVASGTSNHPQCSSKGVDPDGDGWGYENGRSCMVADTDTPDVEDPIADCSVNATDSDGDGFGFENGQRCLIVRADVSGGVVFEQNFERSPIGAYSAEQVNADWDQPLWHLGFVQGRVQIVNEQGRGRVMQVTYPANKYGSQGAAAFLSDLQLGVDLPKSYEQLYLSYDVKFDTGFEFVKGGKLPGLCGYDNNRLPVHGCNTGGGFPDGYDGWSARGMWRQDGALENYMYHSEQDYYYGDSLLWDVKAKPGQWHRIQHRVVLNSPNFANGIIEAWIDGQKVLSKSNMRYRKTADIGINLFYFSTFFGGNDPSWAPSTDQRVFFDNFTISNQPVENSGNSGAFNDETDDETNNGSIEPEIAAANEKSSGGGVLSLSGVIWLLVVLVGVGGVRRSYFEAPK